MSSDEAETTSSPAAPPLEDDDLLSEILLRLPPQPSSLPRASAVSKRWRSLASDPRFCSRFRSHHRRNPPLLGCFVKFFDDIHFASTLDAPNRIPPSRFSVPIHAGDSFRPLGCRHGLALILSPKNQLLVWDPITGGQHRLGIPPAFDADDSWISAAVLRPAAAGDIQHFQVVLVGNSDLHRRKAVASVYSSETGVWGNLITVQLPPDDPSVNQYNPAVMAGDSLYWLISGEIYGILEFDLDRQSLSLIPVPGEEIHWWEGVGNISVILLEDGGLGFLILSKFSAQLWKREMDCDGVSSWLLERTIALDKLLLEWATEHPFILGFAENNNVVLLRTSTGVFAVQLESLQFKKVFDYNNWHGFYPFEVVYTADNSIGGAHDGAELPKNIK
ncbi:uncharacterized protein LOC124689371 [Lolium rigidum]|uniref:uncharacterized protein LOC124689371 n=1 Tax=Lolium rigidum TaxID=89674 RepID=UPI001F5D53D9|nr:uncharacterized protein LOC124689371 [Lolium rigidum]